MKRIGIVGAGSFGTSLAEYLAKNGAEVLIIDTDRELVRDLCAPGIQSVEGDATDLRSLQEAGFGECDAITVAIGDIGASVMATMNCIELKKKVYAKADSDMHGRILKKVGAELVVYPNREQAERLGRSLMTRGQIDVFTIEEGCRIAVTDVPEQIANKSLAEAKVRNEYGLTVLCIRRLSDEDPTAPRTMVLASPQEVLRPDDQLVVFGDDKAIDAISKGT
jgi:K+ transport systems, NAD-binding component